MQEIDRRELQRLLAEETVQLVEVLPLAEYEEEHLPGAISMPLKKLRSRASESLDPRRPVVVYCYDYQ